MQHTHTHFSPARFTRVYVRVLKSLTFSNQQVAGSPLTGHRESALFSLSPWRVLHTACLRSLASSGNVAPDRVRCGSRSERGSGSGLRCAQSDSLADMQKEAKRFRFARRVRTRRGDCDAVARSMSLSSLSISLFPSDEYSLSRFNGRLESSSTLFVARQSHPRRRDGRKRKNPSSPRGLLSRFVLLSLVPRRRSR